MNAKPTPSLTAEQARIVEEIASGVFVRNVCARTGAWAIEPSSVPHEAGDLPRPPFSYWLKPKTWRNEVRYWLHAHNWRKYCHVHDVIHWRWTHRHCCVNQRRIVLRAARKNGFMW